MSRIRLPRDAGLLAEPTLGSLLTPLTLTNRRGAIVAHLPTCTYQRGTALTTTLSEVTDQALLTGCPACGTTRHIHLLGLALSTIVAHHRLREQALSALASGGDGDYGYRYERRPLREHYDATWAFLGGNQAGGMTARLLSLLEQPDDDASSTQTEYLRSWVERVGAQLGEFDSRQVRNTLGLSETEPADGVVLVVHRSAFTNWSYADSFTDAHIVTYHDHSEHGLAILRLPTDRACQLEQKREQQRARARAASTSLTLSNWWGVLNARHTDLVHDQLTWAVAATLLPSFPAGSDDTLARILDTAQGIRHDHRDGLT